MLSVTVLTCMRNPRELYRQLDDRVRELSRGKYAALVGLFSAIGVFVVGLLMNAEMAFEAVTMAITMTIVYYAFDPNSNN